MSQPGHLDGAGTLVRTTDGYTVRFVRHYSRPQAALWRAISSPEGLDTWYPTKLRTDGVVGNLVDETFESPDGAGPEPAPPGVLTAYDPPNMFKYRVDGPDEAPHAGMLGVQTIRIEARQGATGNESVLTFTHLVETLPTALDVLSGWHYCLEYLALEMGQKGEPTKENLERFKRFYQEMYGQGT